MPLARGRPRKADGPMIELLAAGGSVEEVAAALGCSAATVWKRQRSKLFRARVAEARSRQLAAPARDATNAAPRMLAIIAAVAEDEKTEPKVRVAAACRVIEIALKLRADAYVLSRVAALEAAVEEAGIDVPLANEFRAERGAGDEGADAPRAVAGENGDMQPPP